MEWSDRDDAWGDDAWDDADAAATPRGPGDYPPAPVPAHERTWRHPSEVGQHTNQAWAFAEPPVALGRGLLVTTGMIGCALGVAILWLMVPAGGDPPTAETASSSRSAASAPRLTTASPADRGDETGGTDGPSFGSSTATLLTSTTRPAEISSESIATLPGEDSPANTVLVAQVDDAPPAVAVLIGDSPFLVTTANAVGGHAEIDITFDGGDVATVTVVTVDEAVAYLDPQSQTLDPIGFSSVAEAREGDRVHALGGEIVSFAFGDTAALTEALTEAPDDAIVEGTPVVDAQGALVGLCTHGAAGWDVVPIGSPPDDTDAATSTTLPASTSTDAGTASSSTVATSSTGPTTPSTAAPYLGVTLGLDDAGYVLVLGIERGSPADLAGLIVGQRLLAIDGSPLDSPAGLVAAIRGHRPGDSITLTVSASTFPTAGAVSSTYAAVSTTISSGPGSTALAATPTTIATATTVKQSATTTTSAPTTTTSSTSTTSSTGPAAPTPPVAFETYDVIVVLGERAPSV